MAALTAITLAFFLPLGNQAEAASLSLIYKRNSEASAPRSHTAALAALQELENELSGTELELVQPTQELYEQLGDKPGLIVTFARDAGYAALIDSTLKTRPYDGTDLEFATATVTARVTYGNRIVANLSQYAQMPVKKGAAQTRALELAAAKAAKALAGQIAERVARYQQRPSTADNSATASVLSPTLAQPAESEPANTSSPLALSTPVGRRWALLVGVSDFQKVRQLNAMEISDLPAVRNDIVAFRKTLLDLGYSAEHMTVLLDADATTSAVRTALERLASQTRPEDQVLVVLGSHGVPRDGGWSDFGMPVLYDTQLRTPDAFDFERFKTALKKLPAQRVIWANDTCHSGASLAKEATIMVSSRGLVRQEQSGFDEQMAAEKTGKHLAVFASSRESQLSYNTRSNQFGIFSSLFNAALQSTQGNMATLQFYKTQLEAQVPQATREHHCTAGQNCKAVQQPGFAFSGAGDQLRFK